MKWRESLQLGALMNTRGLMELVGLDIGYDMGILSQRIFTMVVNHGSRHDCHDGTADHFFRKEANDPFERESRCSSGLLAWMEA